MEMLKRYRGSIWRVPLIGVIASFFYNPLYINLVLRFGITGSRDVDETAALLINAVLCLAVVVLGGKLFLKKQTKKEIFVSAAVLSGYGVFLMLVQRLTGSVTGPFGVLFMYLNEPFEWTGVFPTFAFYLEDRLGIMLPAVSWLHCLAPFLFVPFGRRAGEE